MLELMRQMSVSIAELDAMADQQAALADILNAHGAVDAIRQAAQYHRQRAEELRSELASLALGCTGEKPMMPSVTLGAFAP